MKLTDDELKAFANITVGRDGEILERWLEKCLAESDRSCRHEEGQKLFQAQGRSQFIAQLLQNFEDARKRMKLTH